MTNPDWDGTMKARAKEPKAKEDLWGVLDRLSGTVDMETALATRIRERLTDQVLAELLVQSPGIPGGIEEFYAVWREGIISAIVGESQ